MHSSVFPVNGLRITLSMPYSFSLCNVPQGDTLTVCTVKYDPVKIYSIYYQYLQGWKYIV